MGLKMRYVLAFFLCFITFSVNSQTRPTGPEPVEAVYLLKPSNVFDGEAAQLHEGWVVLVRGERIEAAGPASEIDRKSTRLNSSHQIISYAVFCFKKKKKENTD